MGDFDFKGRFANTARLAELFCISERQVQRLVSAGVITPCDNGKKPYEFDLTVVGPQYFTFLQSDIPLHQWAPSTAPYSQSNDLK